MVDSFDESGPGSIVLLSSANDIVATLTLAATACGNTADNGVATFNSITSDTNAVGGVIAKGEVRNGLGETKLYFSVTVTGGGGDLTFNNVTVAAGQTVAISGLSYTAPA